MKMLGNFIRRWLGGNDATTAIEFSLIAVPYVFLTIGILELAVTFTTASLLEGATGSAARLIRTGQVQQYDGDPAEMFRTALCDYASALITCDNVVIEVMTMDSFADFGDMTAQFDEDGNMVSQGFSPGASSSRVLVRAAYRYNMMTPLIGPLIAGPDNSILFVSTIVLQSEPYDFEGEI